MANEVFKGLFGFSPEELTQQRQAENDARAFQLAQLNPMQQASYQSYQASQGIRDSIRGIGQKLFNIEDPQMKESALLDSSAKELFSQGIDPMSSKGLTILAERVSAAGGRSETMQRLLQAKQQAAMQEAKIASEQALTSQRNRESNPKEVQLLNLYNSLPDDDPRKEMIKEMLVKEKSQSDPELVKLQDARDALPKGSARYKELDEFIKAKITGEATRGSTTISMPGSKDPEDVPKQRSAFRATIRPYAEAVQSGVLAQKMIKEAISNGNHNALATAVRLLAKASDPRPSNEDVARLLNDPSILGGVSNWASVKLTGMPDQVTLNNLMRVANMLVKDLDESITKEQQTQVRMYKKTGKYSDDDIEMLTDVSDLRPKSAKKQGSGNGAQTYTTKGGNTVTIQGD